MESLGGTILFFFKPWFLSKEENKQNPVLIIVNFTDFRIKE